MSIQKINSVAAGISSNLSVTEKPNVFCKSTHTAKKKSVSFFCWHSLNARLVFIN